MILLSSVPAPHASGAGALWHITSPGIELHSIFVDDEDLERFLALLGKVESWWNGSRTCSS